MVKSGSFTVGQGSLGGRLGSGIGKGLAEQLPKEFERERLKTGLEQFGKESANLSPLEQATKLFSIPGITPQMVQVLPELLKQQNIRNAYGNRAKGSANTVEEQGSLQPKESVALELLGSQGNAPRLDQSGSKIVRPEEQSQPQIVETNPLRQEAIPARPWSNARRDQEISNAFESGFATTLPEAIQYVANKEQRELAQPEAIQKQDQYLSEQKQKLDSDLDSKIKTLLETTDKEGAIYKDLSGEDLNNIRRSANRELRTNAGSTIEDVSNKWANKALELAKTRTELNTLSKKGFLDRLSSPTRMVDDLKSYQKIFAETGNQENFFNTIKEKFGLSDQGASPIAYPISKNVNSYIKSYPKIDKMSGDKSAAQSRKFAEDLSKHITRDDSILSVMTDMRRKDVNFNPYAFLDQLREDQDNLGLTPRQKREIAKGPGSFIPTWGDIQFIPYGGVK